MPNSFLNLSRNGRGFVQSELAYRGGERVDNYKYGETVVLNIQLIEENSYIYNPSAAVTMSVAVGDPYLVPVRGEFLLGNGTATASAIPYNATTTQLKNAVSAVYGNVTVATYGPALTAGYIVTAATVNTALTINGLSQSLAPSAVVDVLELTPPSAAVTAQKIVRLRCSPYVSATTYFSAVTYESTSVTFLGTSNNQQVYRINTATGAKLIPEMWFLSISLNGAVTSGPVGGGMISSLAQPVARLSDPGGGVPGLISQTLMQSYTSTGGGPLLITTTKPELNLPRIPNRFWYASVTPYARTFKGEDGRSLSYTVSFEERPLYGAAATFFYSASTEIDALGNFVVRLSTKFPGVTASLNFNSAYAGSAAYFTLPPVTMASAALDEAFVSARKTTITPTLEITMEEAGSKTVLLQSPVTLRRQIT